MYTVGIREHVMIAHSFKGAAFGPAQRLHGATYVVDAEFERDRLDEAGVVVDIGRASQLLREVLEPLAYRNLDELPEFAGINTTTEFLAARIHGQLSARVAPTFRGRLTVTLHESHVAWGRFSGPVP